MDPSSSSMEDEASPESPPPSNPRACDNPSFNLTSQSEPTLSSASNPGNEQSTCPPGPQHSEAPVQSSQHSASPHNEGDASHNQDPSPVHHLDQRPSATILKTSSPPPADLEVAFYRSTKFARVHDRGLGYLHGLDRQRGGKPRDEATTVAAYTADEAAQDSRAGASLVAWPPANSPAFDTVSIQQRRATASFDNNQSTDDDDGKPMEEVSEKIGAGPYRVLDAALDARRGACFVAWPIDEEWRAPVLCV